MFDPVSLFVGGALLVTAVDKLIAPVAQHKRAKQVLKGKKRKSAKVIDLTLEIGDEAQARRVESSPLWEEIMDMNQRGRYIRDGE
jgi:hypothetical protein